ncbi:hypothetical protein ACHQM5_024057 [Ranunculus cassubicifolius]
MDWATASGRYYTSPVAHMQTLILSPVSHFSFKIRLFPLLPSTTPATYKQKSRHSQIHCKTILHIPWLSSTLLIWMIRLLNRTPDFSVEIFDDRTVMLCDQCEKEHHVGCLRKHGFCDLKELPKGAWFCTETYNRIQKTLWHLVSQGAKSITNSMSSTINKKLIEKGLACEVGGDVRWQLLSGKSPEHKPLLSRVAAIFRESFDPIVESSGTDLIPPMVYGQNIQGNLQEFGGICCAVVSVNSVVVSAGLFRIFGREIAELPLVATTKESRGKGYFQVLFACIV